MIFLLIILLCASLRENYAAAIPYEQQQLGNLLIHNARWNSRLGVLRVLNEGAHLDFQDVKGKTALIHAVEKKHLDILICLLEQKADPHIIDNSNNIALSHAFKAENHMAVALIKLHTIESPPECVIS